MIPAVVLTAALLHAVWNALAHGMKDHLVGFALINVAFAAVGGVGVLLLPHPGRAAIPFVVASAILEVGYMALLLSAYRLGDFAQMYPLARGTAPLLVAAWAATVLAEPLGGWRLLAVLMISGGLITLAFQGGVPGREQLPAVAAAVGTGVTIAAYTIVDGTGVRRSEAVFGYIAWIFLVQGLAFGAVALAVRRRRLFVTVGRRDWLTGLAGGLLSLTAYGMVVWAQSRGNLATIAALRETSIVFAALIGAVVFRERFGYRRMAASAVVVAGIAVLEFAHG